MNTINFRIRARVGTAMAAVALSLGTLALATPANAQSYAYKPSGQLVLSKGEGQMVTTPQNVADVWVSNPAVADVDVTNPRQIKVFGKERGEATLIATGRNGSVVYATNIRVSQNLSSVNDVIRAAMPGSDITVTSVGQIAVLNGTVASPEESSQAQAIVAAYLNPGKKEGDPLDIMPINRLRTATPLQVALRVKIAEVNRSLVKEVGLNLLTSDSTGGFRFGIGQGSGITPGTNNGTVTTPPVVQIPTAGSILTGAGKLFGVDILSALQLSEADGLVTTLAEPTLTALSGETASFLAGGEFPVPISQSLGAVTVEYKQYGVGLAFTPIVLADGRISMRVRPEVSELSNEGTIRLNGFNVPGLTTRRAETTVELGSGQSFMIAGLLRNANTNDVSKAPFLGDLPIIGALFRSTRFRRAETELVIIVTPYLVRPTSGQMALPTNGYRAPTDGGRVFLNQTYTGVSAAPAPASGPVAVQQQSSGVAAGPGFKM